MAEPDEKLELASLPPEDAWRQRHRDVMHYIAEVIGWDYVPGEANILDLRNALLAFQNRTADENARVAAAVMTIAAHVLSGTRRIED